MGVIYKYIYTVYTHKIYYEIGGRQMSPHLLDFNTFLFLRGKDLVFVMPAYKLYKAGLAGGR